jgi:hypothetical protein
MTCLLSNTRVESIKLTEKMKIKFQSKLRQTTPGRKTFNLTISLTKILMIDQL